MSNTCPDLCGSRASQMAASVETVVKMNPLTIIIPGDAPAPVARPATPCPSPVELMFVGFMTPVRIPRTLECPPAPRKARKTKNPFDVLDVE